LNPLATLVIESKLQPGASILVKLKTEACGDLKPLDVPANDLENNSLRFFNAIQDTI